jgi:Uma2 family endonuclease
MDVDEFMGFLEMRPKEERWHLIEGRAVMMSPPSLAHQRIALNLCELLNRGFVAQGSDLYAFHQIAIRLPGVVNFQPEPDVVVAPGTASYELYTEHFRLIGEIPSPSNTRREIDPRELRVEVHAKSRNCQPATLRAADDLIDMPELGLQCCVADLYRGTPLDRQRG